MLCERTDRRHRRRWRQHLRGVMPYRLLIFCCSRPISWKGRIYRHWNPGRHRRWHAGCAGHWRRGLDRLRPGGHPIVCPLVSARRTYGLSRALAAADVLGSRHTPPHCRRRGSRVRLGRVVRRHVRRHHCPHLDAGGASDAQPFSPTHRDAHRRLRCRPDWARAGVGIADPPRTSSSPRAASVRVLAGGALMASLSPSIDCAGDRNVIR